MIYCLFGIVLYLTFGLFMWVFAAVADYHNGYRAKDWAETIGYFCSFVILGPFILLIDFLENRKNF